ncbi:MAG: exosome complex protein Rrp42 [Candidatus Woesearchaeota archaeon]
MNGLLKQHILKSLQENMRFDGRKPLDFRKATVEYDVTKNAEGSARVKFGDTEVMAGVKMEIGKPYPDTPEDGNMMVNAELLPMSSPEFEAGPPDAESVEVARLVDRIIRESKAIDTKKLLITKAEKCWVVSIDICTINAAGNLIDASCLAALAALSKAVFPEYDGTTINYKKQTTQKVPMLKTPIGVTVVKMDGHFLIDPTNEEEKVADARLTVGVTEDGGLCALQKGGDMPLSIDEVDTMIGIAIDKSAELRKVL